MKDKSLTWYAGWIILYPIRLLWILILLLMVFLYSFVWCWDVYDFNKITNRLDDL